MTVRPIIFSAPMVRALLDGRKTQTRRLVSSPLERVTPGDRLWVREGWKVSEIHHKTKPRDLDPATPIYFTAVDPLWPVARCRPGMHMPRWASRLWLDVTEVRVQPLQTITLGDICAEGLARSIYDFKPVQTGFDAWSELWNSLHTKDGERWEDDPDIVALTFTVHHGNIDAAPAEQEAA